MKRLFPLLALAAGVAAAVAYHQTALEETRDEAEALRADLMWAQDNAQALAQERDQWQEIAQLQQQTILRMTTADAMRPETQTGDGGLWIYKDGWCAARGPYVDQLQAKADAEDAARMYQGETIHVLSSTRTVVTAAAEPEWDNA